MFNSYGQADIYLNNLISPHYSLHPASKLYPASKLSVKRLVNINDGKALPARYIPVAAYFQ